MSIATQITRLRQAKAALKEAINTYFGGNKITTGKLDTYAQAITQTESALAVLEAFPTTVRYDTSHTENIVSNDLIRIRGNDGQSYTLAQWNAMFVEAGFNKDNMTVEPVGIHVKCFDTDEVYLFDRYTGITYNPPGDTAGAAGKLQHSLYNNNLVTAAGSGTDFTTGKAWRVTANGDDLILWEENTNQSWTIAKNTGAVNQHRAWNIEERAHSLWAQTEWMRHRMAIDSGLSTTEADGAMGEVEILNASGAQPAVGEDMYFWIGGTNTGKLAKYNLNNRHTVNSASLTQAIADAIYARQVAHGINMNDTGVNSGSRPVLAPGSKGAEAIAVNGKWMIITPYISNPNAAVATISNNLADAPAVYWAVSKGYDLPSDSLLAAMYWNLPMCQAIVTYLNNREHRGLPTIPTDDYIWTAVRSSALVCWAVYLTVGSVPYAITYLRYFVVGSAAS